MYEVQFNPSINKKRENNAGQETKKIKVYLWVIVTYMKVIGQDSKATKYSSWNKLALERIFIYGTTFYLTIITKNSGGNLKMLFF